MNEYENLLEEARQIVGLSKKDKQGKQTKHKSAAGGKPVKSHKKAETKAVQKSSVTSKHKSEKSSSGNISRAKAPAKAASTQNFTKANAVSAEAQSVELTSSFGDHTAELSSAELEMLFYHTTDVQAASYDHESTGASEQAELPAHVDAAFDGDTKLETAQTDHASMPGAVVSSEVAAERNSNKTQQAVSEATATEKGSEENESSVKPAVEKALKAKSKTAEEAAQGLSKLPKEREHDSTAEVDASALSAKILFSDLNLHEQVQLAVQMSGYISPTQIQAEIIPHVLNRRDVLAQSQTGTGKTAAFALPILSNLQEDQTYKHGSGPKVLVLAPTRELATQVTKSFETYGACLNNLRILAIYGGADYEPQLRTLKRGVDIVVGTPGRVIDHIRRETLTLECVQCLVLDEADEMLNMGFIEDIEFVLSQTPAERQIALFSATMPEPIRKIADKYLRDPAHVRIGRKTLTADSIQQKCVIVQERDKLELLSRLIEVEDTDGVIVFTKTKDSTVRVAEHLAQLGISAAALNGDLPQARRQRTVDQLKAGKLDVLVATDVAARGLDVQRISHVFNYDLPHDSESYVHRIGRTGRAGRSGVAVIFLTPAQRGKLRLIEKVTKQTIEIIDPPTAREINLKRVERFKKVIGSTIATKTLTQFKEMVIEYAAESGQPLELIAAALAQHSQGDRALFVKDMPTVASRERDRERDTGSFGRSGAAGESRGPRRRLQPPQSGMQRYRIDVGASDGVRVGNIVGAVANESGISGREIGPIEIHGSFSTIDLPGGLPSDVIDVIGKTWVCGKQLKIRVFTDSPPAGKSEGFRQKRFEGKRIGKPFASAKSGGKGAGGRSGGRSSGGPKSYGSKSSGGRSNAKSKHR